MGSISTHSGKIAFNLKVMPMNQALIRHHRFADQLHTLPNASSKFFGVVGGFGLVGTPAAGVGAGDGDGVIGVGGVRPEEPPALSNINHKATSYSQVHDDGPSKHLS